MKSALLLLAVIMLSVTVGCKNNSREDADSNIRYNEDLSVSEIAAANEPEYSDESTVSDSGAKIVQSYEQVSSTEPKPDASVSKSGPKSESKTSVLPANNNPEPLPETKPETPERATAADTKAVADRVIYHLNKARTEIGSGELGKLSKLGNYAEYRAVQLISNFAHDPGDWQKAAKATGYGKFTDMSEYGSDGYYEIGAQEAIAKAGIVGDTDTVGKTLAEVIINSKRHWQYVGDKNMTYCAVGVACDTDTWYAAILVTNTTAYEN